MEVDGVAASAEFAAFATSASLLLAMVSLVTLNGSAPARVTAGRLAEDPAQHFDYLGLHLAMVKLAAQIATFAA